MRASQPFEHRVLSSLEKPAFVGQLILLTLIFCMILIQYNALYFLLTVMSGNVFINCLVMGCGEIITALLAGYLLRKFKDTHVFLCANFLVVIFHTLF